MFLLPFHLIGCAHDQNDVEQLGRARILPAQLDDALASLREAGAPVVLISTCHRTELYWWGEADLAPWFHAHLASRGVANMTLVQHRADLAVRHLFAVSAGMRSVRFGEPEILGQVRRAWRASQGAGVTNSGLDGIFRRAVDAARHIRTAIGSQASESLGMRVHEAVRDLRISRPAHDTAEPTFEARPSRVMVVGSGDAARSVLEAFTGHGSEGESELFITSRTDPRAEALARELNTKAVPVHAVPWSTREPHMAAADVVIFAVHSITPILSGAHAGALFAARSAPAIWVDLGVPPNVSDVDLLPEAVQLVDLAWLALHSGDDAARARCASQGDMQARAHLALQRELARFADEMHRRRVGSRLASIEQRAVDAARAALESHAPGVGHAGVQQAADVLARQVTRLLLRELTALSA